MSEFRRRLLSKKDSGELKENEILAIYNVTTTESDTKLLGGSYTLSNVTKMKIDDVEVTPVKNFTFTTKGRHVVKMTLPFNITYLFQNCSALIGFDFSKLKPKSAITVLFGGCSSLSEISFFDTSKAVSADYAFYNTAITTIPLLNTSNVKNFRCMFQNCSKLITIPLIDSSKGTNFGTMFASCVQLKTIPQINTSNGSDFSYMFMNCSELTDIPLLDFSSATNLTQMFMNANNVVNIGGFKNLKASISIPSSKLTPLSVHNIIEQALGNFTLTLNATAKANWQNSEYFYEDYLMLKEKNITIADLTITSIIIPEGITTIGNNAFANCTSLESIVIPSTVTYIGDNAFRGCINVSTITMNPTTAPTLGENVWGNNESNYIGSNVSYVKFAFIKNEYIGYDTDKWNVLFEECLFIKLENTIKAIGSNGSDYLVLDYKPNRNTIIRVEYKHSNTIGGSEPFIDAGDWANATSKTNRFAVIAADQGHKGLYVAIGDIIGAGAPLIDNDVNKKTFFNIDMNTFTITTALGTTDLSKNLNVTGFTSSDFLHIFKRNDTNKITPNKCIFIYRISVIENNTPIAGYLPFKDDNGNGLINVMNNTKFYGAKGTKFIEEL